MIFYVLRGNAPLAGDSFLSRMLTSDDSKRLRRVGLKCPFFEYEHRVEERSPDIGVVEVKACELLSQ